MFNTHGGREEYPFSRPVLQSPRMLDCKVAELLGMVHRHQLP